MPIHKYFLISLCLLFFAFSNSRIYAVEKVEALLLTEEEREWISKHPVIRLGVDPAFAPFEFVAEDGQYLGIASDYVKRIGLLLGLKMEPVTGLAWKKVVEKAKRHEIDVLPCVGITEERKQYFSYSKPYLVFPRVIIARNESTVKSLDDLHGRKVGVQANSSHHGFLKEQTTLQPILYDTFQEAVRALSRGEADAVIGNLAVATHTIQKLSLTNLKVAAHTTREYFPLAFAVRKDWQMLVGLLNKAMGSFSEEEKAAILKKWIPVQFNRELQPRSEHMVVLTEEEQAWLRAHPKIRVHNETNWAPFNFFENGEPTGLSIDYMNLLAQRIGIQVEYISDPSWNKFLGMIKRKELDIMLNIVKTEDRQKYILYTEPYVINPNVIVSDKDNRYGSIEELFGKTVTFPKGFFYEEVLTKNYPQINRLPVEDTLASLKAVSFGKADAALGENAVFHHLINKHMLTDLAVSGEVDIGNPDLVNLRIGIRNDWKPLQSIIIKAMSSVAVDEMNRIRQKWLLGREEFRKTVSLTAEEKAWLAEHPVIRLGFHVDFGPGLIVGEDGTLSGILIDLFDQLNRELGTNIIIETGPWADIQQRTREGDIDGLLACAPILAKKSGLLSTRSHVTVYLAIFAHKNTRKGIRNFKDLKGKTVAIVKGFLFAKNILKPYLDKIDLIETQTTLEAMKLVYEGKADAVVGLNFDNYLIGKHALTGISPVYIDLGRPLKSVTAIRKDWPELVGLLNKGIKAVGEAEINTIVAKWTNLPQSKRLLNFSDEENAWLRAHPKIRIGVDPAYPPFDYVGGDGTHQGVASDYVRLISERLGISMEMVPGLSWAQVLEGAKNKAVDVIPLLGKTKSRENYLKFTETYVFHPTVLITRNDYAFVTGLADFHNKTMAVVKGYSNTENLKAQYPSIKHHEVGTPLDALRTVALGKVDGYVAELGVSGYLIQVHGLTNLKIAAPTDLVNPPLGFGVRDDWPELISILNKALASISEKERLEITKKWIALADERPIDYTIVWQIAGVMGVIIVLGLLWNFQIQRQKQALQKNITKRIIVEKELKASKEEAVSATLAKSDFLASMSHEIRTPMNAIIGMADLLQETPLTPQQQQYVRVFQSAGENLLNIINDILDISKVEAGHLDLEAIDFDLGELVEKTCEIMALRAHEKNLELAYRVMLDVPSQLVGDQVRLRQILVNLVGNAVKFTEKGEVVVEVRIADLPCGIPALRDPLQVIPQGEELRNAELKKDNRDHSEIRNQKSEIELLFSVTDTGIGIPLEKVDTIFDIFTQADSSTTRKHGGTGLGLTISKRLVELMGGRIWVESPVDCGMRNAECGIENGKSKIQNPKSKIGGPGSTFYFTASFNVQAEPERYVQPPPVDIKGLKTLVVDDNATNRMILRQMLSQWGALVTVAEDGERGLAELKHAMEADDPYQLALIDSRMPVMDGFGLVEHTRKELGIVDITIMMLTSDRRSGDIDRCRELEIARYLVKPIKQSDLLDAITAAIGKTKMVAEGPAVTRPAATEDLRALHILLVEDSADNRLLIQSYLKKTPYQIDIAKNGEIAVEKFTSGKYDLVLMDMQMPVMDGYAATREIRKWEASDFRMRNADFGMKDPEKHNREQSAFRGVPIIALTAYATKEEKQKSLDAGCIAHLTKPIKKAKLMESILKYTQSKGEVAMAQGNNEKQGERTVAHVDAELEDLIPGFLENRQEDIRSIREALEKDDYETIRTLGHSMKGSGGGYGFDAITDIGRSLEDAAKEKNAEEIRTRVGELLHYLEHVEVIYE